MPVSVSDVLALEPLADGRPEVVAGAGFLGRPVRWVHVTQLTDLTGLLRGGELVLTTAEALAAADGQLPAYFARLGEAGAAGVVIEASGPGGGLARRLGEAAREARFPVVLLSGTVRFVDVTEAVHSQIVNEHYDELKFTQRAHEAFTTLSLEHASLETIVARAAALSGTAVVFEDVAHRVLASTPAPGESAADLLSGWEKRSRLAPQLGRTGVSGDEEWLHTPVDVHRQAWGRLVMPRSAGPEQSRPRVRMVLERAAQALSLRLMAEQNQADVERRAQGGLINDLVEGRVAAESEALARAQAVGLRPGAHYVPLAVRFTLPEGPGASAAPDPLDAQRRESRHLTAVTRAVKASGLSCLTTTHHTGETVMLLSCAGPTDEDRLLSRLAAALSQQLPRAGQEGRTGQDGRPGQEGGPARDGGPGWRIGVGHGGASLVAAARRLPEAGHIAEVAASMDGAERPYHRSGDLRLRGLLSLLRDNRHVRAFAESELYRILEDEARNGPELLDLLRDHLAVNGNKNALARRTGLSRPTLYTRIAAIERLLGVDLDDPESRACLYVALLVRELA